MRRSFALTAALLAACAGVAALAPYPANAEPYLAVENGFHCRQCHTDPSGGGKRSVFGTTFARAALTQRVLFDADGNPGWNGNVHPRVGVGGDVRGGWSDIDVPGAPGESDTGITRATLYGDFRAVPELLSFHVDYQVAPDDTRKREAYAFVTPADGRVTIKAGQFFLPFGLRLEDDGAFVRQRSGINFATPDDGVEFGLELPRWSAQAALTNGTSGAGDAPGRRQTSLSAAHVRPRWRLGASYNVNEDPLGDRRMIGVFGGFRTGPIAWLAELDFITDESPAAPDTDIYASLLEGNLRIAESHNLKVSYDFVDPSDRAGGDERERYSLIWEHHPIQLVQTRAGVRVYNGVPGDAPSNRDELFIELHAYF